MKYFEVRAHVCFTTLAEDIVEAEDAKAAATKFLADHPDLGTQLAGIMQPDAEFSFITDKLNWLDLTTIEEA